MNTIKNEGNLLFHILWHKYLQAKTRPDTHKKAASSDLFFAFVVC